MLIDASAIVAILGRGWSEEREKRVAAKLAVIARRPKADAAIQTSWGPKRLWIAASLRSSR